VELVTPDLFLMVLILAAKTLSLRACGSWTRDGFLVIDRGINAPLWEDVARGMWGWKTAVSGEAAALR